MENRTLAKLYVQTKKEKNYEKNTQYQEQILAIEGFSEEVDGVIINHEKIYMDIFDIKIDVMLSVDVHAKKPNKEVLNKKIDQLNELLSKFSDETRKTVYEKLAKCYSDVAAIYKPYKKNQEAITALLNKALDAGIPASYLKAFLDTYKVGLDEETATKLSKLYHESEKLLKSEKMLKEIEQALPTAKYEGVEDVAKYGPEFSNAIGIIDCELDKNLCIELFKNYLDSKSSLTQEEKAVLTDQDAIIEAELFYFPIGILKWRKEPNRYRYIYKHESYSSSVTTTSTNKGTFNFGGGTTVTTETYPKYGSECVEDYYKITDAAEVGLSNFQTTPKPLDLEGKYIQVNLPKKLYTPSSLICKTSDAKAAIIKEIGCMDYEVKVELLESGELTYEALGLVYIPMFGIKISNNNYVAKGVINAYDNSKVAITSLGKIDENGFYQSLQKEKSESAGKYKPKKKSFFSKLFLILSIIATGFGIYKSFLLDDLPAKIVFVLPAILSLIFSIIGVKKPHRKIGKVCMVLAFIALLAFVGICFMAGGNIGCSGNGETVNPGFFLIR